VVEVTGEDRASDLVLRAGAFDSLLPEQAGWRYLSLGLNRIPEGASSGLGGGDSELALVVLSGSLMAEVDGERWTVGGRFGVFSGPPWAIYLPPGQGCVLTATADAQIAVVGARAERRGGPRLIRPEDVEVEVRGAGSATRQINHILPPQFPAHRLLVVEVLTPGGNWSSYPPHKHDIHDPPQEVQLEEFYYFRIRPPEGFAFQRVYSPERGTELAAAVGDGDVVLVPHGYHVSGAPHAFDLYYLNGLAGDARSMAATDDPDMAWIRETWREMERDIRVPMYAPKGVGRARP
jgi:5-deoxy-glucuronate isomerase